jgi:hypothetical protein
MEKAMTNQAYKDRLWERQPAAEAVYRALLGKAVADCPPAATSANRMIERAGVRLRDVVDHLVISDPTDIARLEDAGWRKDIDSVWRNKSGMFPPAVYDDRAAIWLRVESLDQYIRANALQGVPEGKAHGQVRRLMIYQAGPVAFGAIERNGYPGFDVPETAESVIRNARVHLSAFRARRREFDTVEQGLQYTEGLVDEAVFDLGPHWACDLWLKAEREFWVNRCSSGHLQKQRQDAVGIGWSNIDHHTYDSSRRHFRHTIRILEKLGYELREMLYAGELAGWGSQVLEQPVIGSTIFADVDLDPEELTIDFAHDMLPELTKHHRAGLLSELLGESILEAGLNHVAGLYDQKVLRAQLRQEGLSFMEPFSDFPYLYQELTSGDWTPVDPRRVNALEAAGHINADEAEKLRLEGTIISHLENIERNDGFKGFNREGIDSVLRKIDPRAYHAEEASQAIGSVTK